ncbi:hypothetical protein GCM10028824_41390 [Hymenobacter segetis]|uniref:DUF4468 domain-containing protein n=1 Tax=Hymenobacter segetis TaxID=2025509 RepID=A0ABU9M1B7_9BACT
MTWRLLLLALLLLHGFLAAAQPTHYEWPRAAGTDSIAFEGVLPWPAEAGTEAERAALVRRWYHTRLNETQDHGLMEWRAPEARTYAGLPTGAHQELPLTEEVCRLTFRLALRPTPAGLAYRLWAFTIGRAGFDNATVSDLEQVLREVPGPHPELDRMQHRLRVALAHW